jgi:hypothetical protein
MARSISVPTAVSALLLRLYRDSAPSKPRKFKNKSKDDRNNAIRIRFANGENLIDLAEFFNISSQRVYQIIHGHRK